MSLENQEIEHKFLVDLDFSKLAFAETLRHLQPLRESELTVTDTYFVLHSSKSHIFRHRLDSEIQQLSVKSLGDQDNESRLEVNLALLPHNQLDKVQAFLAPLGVAWQASLVKEIHVFYFTDCEVVFYNARYGEQALSCVEFEAVGAPDLAAARNTLDRYEKVTGFNAESRCRKSLFELLLERDFLASC